MWQYYCSANGGWEPFNSGVVVSAIRSLLVNEKKIPEIFSWINKTDLLSSFNYLVDRSWKEIILCNKWDILLKKGDISNYELYLLVKWKLSVYDEITKLAEIHEWDIVWEIWFLLKVDRTADVIAEEPSYLLKIDSNFVNSLSEPNKAIFYENLSKRLASRLKTSNRQSNYCEIDLSSTQRDVRMRTQNLLS